MRPGPEQIESNLAPGGIVIHAYDTDGRLLLDRQLPDLMTARATAEADAKAVSDQLSRREVVLVIYDGDDGHRWTPLEILGYY